jgi:SHS2 domain-containing protein
VPPGQRYELLDHTADVAIRVGGGDLSVLLANLAYAACDLMADADSVAQVVTREIRIAAAAPEQLIVQFVGELLFLFDTERLLLPWAELTHADPKLAVGRVSGEAIDLHRHAYKGELKAATYANLRLRHDDALWQIDLVLDV